MVVLFTHRPSVSYPTSGKSGAGPDVPSYPGGTIYNLDPPSYPHCGPSDMMSASLTRPSPRAGTLTLSNSNSAGRNRWANAEPDIPGMGDGELEVVTKIFDYL